MICDNLRDIRRRIAEAAGQCGRDPEEIKLLAVSKKMGPEAVMEAYRCGQVMFGENFLQEARTKIPVLDPAIRWHFIGHLQSNKARQAAELFTMIETVDRIKIARALDKHAGSMARNLDVLVQVNAGREKRKSGIAPENAGRFMKEIATLPHLQVRGLMTIPPWSADPEDSRPFFRELKSMAEDFRAEHLFADSADVIVSMGMTNDFTVAIEEGATLIRIGTAIFGART